MNSSTGNSAIEPLVFLIQSKYDGSGAKEAKAELVTVGQTGVTANSQIGAAAKKAGKEVVKASNDGAASVKSQEKEVSKLVKTWSRIGTVITGAFSSIQLITRVLEYAKTAYEWINRAEIERKKVAGEALALEKERLKTAKETAEAVGKAEGANRLLAASKETTEELKKQTKERSEQLQFVLEMIDAEAGVFDANSAVKRAEIERDYNDDMLAADGDEGLERQARRKRDDALYTLQIAEAERKSADALAKLKAVADEKHKAVSALEDAGDEVIGTAEGFRNRPVFNKEEREGKELELQQLKKDGQNALLATQDALSKLNYEKKWNRVTDEEYQKQKHDIQQELVKTEAEIKEKTLALKDELDGSKHELEMLGTDEKSYYDAKIKALADENAWRVQYEAALKEYDVALDKSINGKDIAKLQDKARAVESQAREGSQKVEDATVQRAERAKEADEKRSLEEAAAKGNEAVDKARDGVAVGIGKVQESMSKLSEGSAKGVSAIVSEVQRIVASKDADGRSVDGGELARVAELLQSVYAQQGRSGDNLTPVINLLSSIVGDLAKKEAAAAALQDQVRNLEAKIHSTKK